MTSSLLLSLAALTVVAFTSCYGGTSLEFYITPDNIVANMTKSVSMHCGIAGIDKRAETQSSAEDLHTALLLSIINADGKTIANVQDDRASVVVADGDPTASGSLNSRNLHLDLTFRNPPEMAIGEYTCHMVGFSTNSRQINLIKTSSVSARSPTIYDLVQEIREERARDTAHQRQITLLQGNVSSLESSLSSLKSQDQRQNTLLQGKVSSLESSLSSLRSQVNTMQTSLNNIVIGVDLVGGSAPDFSSGAVGLIYGSRRGWLCDDVFDRNNNGAIVVCRMLGFRSGRYEPGSHFVPYPTYIGSPRYDFLLDNVECTGDEASLVECSHTPYGASRCGKGEIAGVQCFP